MTDSLFSDARRKLVIGTEVLRTGGGAALTATECSAILERFVTLEVALRAMREVASVSYSGDPWYAEQEGLDVSHAFAQARLALGENE